MANGSRMVYSTDPGENQRCPHCGELVAACTCTAAPAVPKKPVVKLRLEKGGRGGKEVTVLYDLPANPAFLKDLASKLKRALGTGGTAKTDSVELQGDYRERLRQLLPTLGFKVKG